MGEDMRPFSYRELLSRSFREYLRFGSVFDVPKECFYRSGEGAGAQRGRRAQGLC